MKLCKDCLHCDQGQGVEPPSRWPQGVAFHFGCNYRGSIVDPVSGNHIALPQWRCYEQRSGSLGASSCGPDAKYFDPIEKR